MSISPVVDSFALNLKCKTHGMPIIYVCNVPSNKERLACATCMISSHAHLEKNLVNIKHFLNSYVSAEESRDKIIVEN
jgi:hypothetical protein